MDSIAYLINKPYEIGLRIHDKIHNLNQGLENHYKMNKDYDHPLYTKRFLGSKKRGSVSIPNVGTSIISFSKLTFFQWSLKFPLN